MAEIHLFPSEEGGRLAFTEGKRTVAPHPAPADETRLELAHLRDDLALLQRRFSEERTAHRLERERASANAVPAVGAAGAAKPRSADEPTVPLPRDPLTDTPDRALMLDRIELAISSARRRGTRIALVFADIDRFEQLSERLGAGAGDATLQLVARRLEAALRDSDSVSRHGGDEFLILLTELIEASDAVVIVERMLTSVAAAAQVQSQVFHPSVSLGIAVWPEDGSDPASLITLADAAMCRSRQRGAGGYAFHSVEAEGDGSLELFPAVASTPTRQEAVALADEPRRQDLREVNEQLVIAALKSQARGVVTVQEHRQQLRFLAMVAHELRGPLAPIRMASELLGRIRSEDPIIGRQQQIIARQVRHMNRLIEDLLDGSRVSAGKFRVECAELDLHDVLVAAADAALPGLTARDQRLIRSGPAASLPVQGDAMRLTQVFTNLLDNASKYTQKGGEVRFDALRLETSIEIAVSDNGIGISAETLPRIFELFVQDKRALAVNDHGLGIGLAVVQNLVEAHDGSVVASSAGLDLGSRFTVTLPLAHRTGARAP